MSSVYSLHDVNFLVNKKYTNMVSVNACGAKYIGGTPVPTPMLPPDNKKPEQFAPSRLNVGRSRSMLSVTIVNEDFLYALIKKGSYGKGERQGRGMLAFFNRNQRLP